MLKPAKVTQTEQCLKDLTGKKLDGFTIEQYTEVYKTNEDGTAKQKSLGYFKDDDVAKAFAGGQVDAPWYEAKRAFLLTDGKVAFLLGSAVKLADDAAAALAARQTALAKLTSEERKLLGV